MSRRHVVQQRETLQQIARRYYGDPDLYGPLALYNGIRNPQLIFVGQAIEIPSARELAGGAPAPQQPVNRLPAPKNLDEIVSAFGNIYDFIKEDGTIDVSWETQYLATTPLPFSIPLSGSPSKQVTRIYCHRKLTGILSDAFATIREKGLADRIKTYGGCFNFRSTRKGAKLSTHCWGIAIDLNVESNPMGSTGDMDPGVVAVFRDLGFKWGGDWPGRNKDPMHFQYCTGY